MMIRTLAAALACVFFTGCAVGPNVGRFSPATAPGGVEAVLRLDRQTVRGELLAVESSAFVLLIDRVVTRVPYDVVRGATFPQTSIRIDGRPPDATALEKLRLLSRFPQGLSPSLVEALLAAYGQSEIALLR